MRAVSFDLCAFDHMDDPTAVPVLESTYTCDKPPAAQTLPGGSGQAARAACVVVVTEA
jgi:hypothetical protein